MLGFVYESYNATCGVVLDAGNVLSPFTAEEVFSGCALLCLSAYCLFMFMFMFMFINIKPVVSVKYSYPPLT